MKLLSTAPTTLKTCVAISADSSVEACVPNEQCDGSTVFGRPIIAGRRAQGDLAIGFRAGSRQCLPNPKIKPVKASARRGAGVAMAPDLPAAPPLTGTVECDETNVGGKPRNKGNNKRGRGTSKTPAFAAVARGGSIRRRVVAM